MFLFRKIIIITHKILKWNTLVLALSLYDFTSIMYMSGKDKMNSDNILNTPNAEPMVNIPSPEPTANTTGTEPTVNTTCSWLIVNTKNF